jgi:CRISPR type III-A-associated protein Csm2
MQQLQQKAQPIKWYNDPEKKIMNHLLFYSETNSLAANKVVEGWTEPDMDNRGQQKKDYDGNLKYRGFITKTQLRRYYNDIKNIEKQWGNKKENWDSVKPLVVMMKAKISYDSRKSNNKLPQVFQDFLNNCITNINESADFAAFLKYFEAVVGFYYGRVKELQN